MNEEERAAVVDTYFDRQVSLVESGLFDVVGHVDFVERNNRLRGYTNRDQYVRVAEALTGADVVPEINAGRVLGEYGQVHPAPEFLDVLLEHDVRFTAGTDAHAPDEFLGRVDVLSDLFDERGIEPQRIHR